MACGDCKTIAASNEQLLSELARVRRSEHQMRLGLDAAQEALAATRGEIKGLRAAVEALKATMQTLTERLAFAADIMRML